MYYYAVAVQSSCKTSVWSSKAAAAVAAVDLARSRTELLYWFITRQHDVRETTAKIRTATSVRKQNHSPFDLKHDRCSRLVGGVG